MLDGYEHTIAATVQLALDHLKTDPRPAAGLALDVLSFIATMASKPVPLAFVQSLMEFVDDRDHDFESVVASLAVCVDHGLLIQVVII